MAIINKIENVASVTYNGSTLSSLPAETLLLVMPIITKAVDKAVAGIGDILTYTIVITNLGLVAMTNLPFKDVIPAGAEYEEGSFKLNGATVVPAYSDNTLTYSIPSIAGVGTATIVFQVQVVGGENEV